MTSARRYCHSSCLLACLFLCVCICFCICSLTCVGSRISWKLLDLETWLQWSTRRKWHMLNRMVTWSMMSRDPLRADGVAHAWQRLRSLAAFLVCYVIAWCCRNCNYTCCPLMPFRAILSPDGQIYQVVNDVFSCQCVDVLLPCWCWTVVIVTWHNVASDTTCCSCWPGLASSTTRAPSGGLTTRLKVVVST